MTFAVAKGSRLHRKLSSGLLQRVLLEYNQICTEAFVMDCLLYCITSCTSDLFLLIYSMSTFWSKTVNTSWNIFKTLKKYFSFKWMQSCTTFLYTLASNHRLFVPCLIKMSCQPLNYCPESWAAGCCSFSWLKIPTCP